MKALFEFIFDTLKTAVLALAIVIPIRYFLFQPFVVSGSSMSPNFETGDYLLIDEISYRFRQPERGEVIVFNAPQTPGARYIKRIVGLPGETVKVGGGKVAVFGEAGKWNWLDESVYLSREIATYGDEIINLGKEEYFVLGDNRIFSSDSRSWGVLPRENIVGRAFFRAWPVNDLALILKPFYQSAVLAP